ncbi:hypothetical protein MAR_011141 [Mya arenaria]|uniref:Uncharacterized protein n=1 Tax=Mya arenaria TaxID=6604 RepID=A0ABY7FWK5_MYAAR|nr:hypothetical protein MAR_011141 [Mya arenaria]
METCLGNWFVNDCVICEQINSKLLPPTSQKEDTNWLSGLETRSQPPTPEADTGQDRVSLPNKKQTLLLGYLAVHKSWPLQPEADTTPRQQGSSQTLPLTSEEDTTPRLSPSWPPTQEADTTSRLSDGSLQSRSESQGHTRACLPNQMKTPLLGLPYQKLKSLLCFGLVYSAGLPNSDSWAIWEAAKQTTPRLSGWVNLAGLPNQKQVYSKAFGEVYTAGIPLQKQTLILGYLGGLHCKSLKHKSTSFLGCWRVNFAGLPHQKQDCSKTFGRLTELAPTQDPDTNPTLEASRLSGDLQIWIEFQLNMHIYPT